MESIKKTVPDLIAPISPRLDTLCVVKAFVNRPVTLAGKDNVALILRGGSFEKFSRGRASCRLSRASVARPTIRANSQRPRAHAHWIAARGDHDAVSQLAPQSRSLTLRQSDAAVRPAIAKGHPTRRRGSSHRHQPERRLAHHRRPLRYRPLHFSQSTSQ
jgi:hypothetical protein